MIIKTVHIRKNVDTEDIEKALGFKLRENQLEIICMSMSDLMRMPEPTERNTGATTAAALRLLLSRGTEVLSSEDSLVREYARVAGDSLLKYRFFMFCETVFCLAEKLIKAGINIHHFRMGTRSTESFIKNTVQMAAKKQDIAAVWKPYNVPTGTEKNIPCLVTCREWDIFKGCWGEKEVRVLTYSTQENQWNTKADIKVEAWMYLPKTYEYS